LVEADPVQIEQILLNFAINGSHAMTIMRGEDEKWGGDLIVEIEKFKADNYFIAHHPDAKEIDYWVISIKDEGVGMTPETISKIFNPFFTTKHEGTGTGLGLAMVYNIVKQHRGIIEVSSELHKGSVFKVYMPALCKTGKVESRPETSISLPMGEGLILIVDDEDLMRQVASEIFAECGYKTMTASDGEQALEIYEKMHQEIKAVLLDMNMPIMNGKDAFMKMKKINPEVKVLLGSGFPHEEKVDDLLRLGIHEFVPKPYNMEQLSQAIERVVKLN